MVEVEPDALLAGSRQMGDLKADAQTIADVGEDVSPAPTTWGPFVGLILGIPYSLARSDMEELLSTIPLALENHEIRLALAAQVYEENDQNTSMAIEVIEADVERVQIDPC